MTGEDAAAEFTAIFDRERRALHAYLLGRVADRELATDLLQETFARLWTHLGQVRLLPDGERRAWLYTVARHLVVDSGRAAAGRRNAEAALRRHPAAAAEPGPEQQLERRVDEELHRQRLDRLGREIARLPDELRVVLTMATAGGLSSRRIGEALDLPAGTVRYRLHRARALLQAAMSDGPDGSDGSAAEEAR